MKTQPAVANTALVGSREVVANTAVVAAHKHEAPFGREVNLAEKESWENNNLHVLSLWLLPFSSLFEINMGGEREGL